MILAVMSDSLTNVRGSVFESPKVIPPKSIYFSSIKISGMIVLARTGILSGLPPLMLTTISDLSDVT